MHAAFHLVRLTDIQNAGMQFVGRDTDIQIDRLGPFIDARQVTLDEGEPAVMQPYPFPNAVAEQKP